MELHPLQTIDYLISEWFELIFFEFRLLYLARSLIHNRIDQFLIYPKKTGLQLSSKALELKLNSRTSKLKLLPRI